MAQDHRATIRNMEKAKAALKSLGYSGAILRDEPKDEDLQKLEAYKRRLLDEAIKEGHAHGDRIGEPIVPKGRCPLCHDSFEDDGSLIWRCGHFNRQMHAECLLTMGSGECECRANLREDLNAPAPKSSAADKTMGYWHEVREDLRKPPPSFLLRHPDSLLVLSLSA